MQTNSNTQQSISITKMYSKEDLIQAFKDGENNMKYSEMDGWFRKLTFQKWFQQFKKK